MSMHDDVLRAVDGFYAAALHDGDWHGALAAVVDLTGSRAICAEVHDLQQGTLSANLFVNYDHLDLDRLGAAYHEHYYKLDPEHHYLAANPGARYFYDGIDRRFVPDATREFARFSDWERREIGRYYHLTGMGRAGTRFRTGITLDRSSNQGPAGSSEIELFKVLWRHLENAFEAALRLGTWEDIGQATLSRFATDPAGLILLDRQGRMLFANPAAETMLAANDGLAARDRDLRVGLPETERRYRAILARALDPARQAPTATPEFLRVPRPSGSGLPYVLSVTRCPASERMMSGEPPAALLTIVDPERRQAPAAKLLRAGFGLSAQEAALAARLCAGETLDEAARRLGIGRETARTHLSGAFAKTGTRRQHALVALLNSALVGLG